MNKAEATKLLNIISATYQGFQIAEDIRDQWAAIFEAESFDNVKTALMGCIKKNSKGFAPTPGEILAVIPKDATSRTVEITEGKYYDTVKVTNQNATGKSCQQYQMTTRADMRRYNANMERKGFCRILLGEPGKWISVWERQDRCVWAGGRWHRKIDYCMDVLGAAKVETILRQELGIPKGQPDNWMSIDFVKYKKTLNNMVMLAGAQ